MLLRDAELPPHAQILSAARPPECSERRRQHARVLLERLRLAGSAALIALLLMTGLATRASAQLGYFRIDNRDGIWWLLDPTGAPMISMGVDTMHYAGDAIDHSDRSPYRDSVQSIYPDRNTWGLANLARLRLWGFNTIGAWSDDDLWKRDIPYVIDLEISEHAGGNWEHGKPVDVYDPQFEQVVGEIAEQQIPHTGDHWLLGYFSDNELRWGPDWRGHENMLQMYLAMPPNSAGRQRAVDFLRQRYGDSIRRLEAAWGVKVRDFAHVPTTAATPQAEADNDQFLEQVATHYFDVCARAIHNADPNHLYLGARFAGKVPDAVLRAARLTDVVSVNIYSFDPRPLVQHMFQITGKPILVTEFAFRAENSGLPNAKGAGPKVPDQAARAKAYADYVTWLESLPEAIGFHWFQWEDEPAEGRFDGENSNYGMVDIHDQPYAEFVKAVTAANHAAVEAHKNAGKPAAAQTGTGGR